MLQERIEELGSGILDIKENKVHLLGFYSKDRLEDYLNNNMKCASSYGIYDYQLLDFNKIKDDTLFIVRKNNVILSKHYFQLIFKDTFKFKNSDKKITTRTYSIRYSKYTKNYNLVIEKQYLLFTDLNEIANYLNEKYNYVLNIENLINCKGE